MLLPSWFIEIRVHQSGIYIYIYIYIHQFLKVAIKSELVAK